MDSCGKIHVSDASPTGTEPSVPIWLRSRAGSINGLEAAVRYAEDKVSQPAGNHTQIPFLPNPILVKYCLSYSSSDDRQNFVMWLYLGCMMSYVQFH
jgi:hypothetical protein